MRMPMARGKTARRSGEITKGVIGGVDESGALLPGEYVLIVAGQP
jgi:hypothetical protein